MTDIRFKSFSSGSCGNCYFLGVAQDGRIRSGVLIDAGVSMRRVKRELQAEGLTLDDFSAILVTHDHMDHIRSLGSYAKHLQRPIWASETLHKALASHVMTHEYVPDCKRVLRKGEWNEVVPGDISVRYFVVPHDATETVGFAIRLPGHNYVHITDCGRMTDEALELCRQADTVVLESNYDLHMLEVGPYPKELQDRIRSGSGHLSNDDCAEAIKKIAHKGLRNLFLCHLSENNNTPELAYESARAAIKLCPNKPVRLEALPRQTPSQMIIL
ncbi:MAG: MBL fold metallo-hydrolase [Bacteroidales bacterium]|nr:MBL fold metallo-hydrolase [Bacteroidales bacterium]